MRRAKIVVTIGPASTTKDVIRSLVEAGMDFARLNFSHGTHSTHAKTIKALREVADELDRPLGILLDLQGPRIRTGRLMNSEPAKLEIGERLILTPNSLDGDAKRVHVSYENLAKDVSPGNRILVDDGKIELRVTEVTGDDISTEVVVAGILGENKGLNLPGVRLSANAITAKDRADLAFGLVQDVDEVALSFVRRGKDIEMLRELIVELRPEQRPLPIIAKLEREEAIEALDEIMEQADGVMVARGDLGVNVSPERVPSLQKKIIFLANKKQRPVITATQMLVSMIESNRPTRAEASDVANAVFDGSDALMLSGETAVGNHPSLVVETMDRIICDAESHAREWGFLRAGEPVLDAEGPLAATHAGKELAMETEASAIAVFTTTGRTARLMSASRPTQPILAFTPQKRTYCQLSLLWGVRPHLIPLVQSVEAMVDKVEDVLAETGELKPGQKFVLVASYPVGKGGSANFAYLHTMRDRQQSH